MKILVTPTSLQPGKNEAMLERLRAFSQDLVFNPTGRPLKASELKELLKDCDGYIAGLDEISADALSDCPRLKVISRYGSGYDSVDLKAAKEKGIVVTYTPGVNAEAVGELTFGLILAVARRIPYLDRTTREGGWVRSTGMELYGKTLGILGLGAIGKVVARCGAGFGMHVCAYDPFINEAYCEEHQIASRSFEEVICSSDVISLHMPLLESTKHLIDKDAFAKMKKGTVLVNASRGGIIDEDAAYAALKDGTLAGLGLDAFEVEPPEYSRLFEFDNVIATPHTGAHTREAADNMARLSIDNLVQVLTGGSCPYIVDL